MTKDLKWYVNVNKQTIAKNIKRTPEEQEPPVRVCRGKSGKGTYGFEVELPEGSVVKYDAHKPILRCGARLVIICPTEPEIIF